MEYLRPSVRMQVWITYIHAYMPHQTNLMAPRDPLHASLTPWPLHLTCFSNHQKTHQMSLLILWDNLPLPLDPWDPIGLPLD